jgi:hypothetical protein
MKKILTATLAVAIALAPASAITQGVITGQQTYVTGSKPDAKPGKYKVVKIKKAKAVHNKHSYKVTKAPPGKYKVAKVKTTKAVHHKHSYKVAKAPPGKYKVAKVKTTKAVHHKHSYKVAHYATTSYRPGHHPHHWHGHHHWLLAALVAVGLGLFRFWH